MALKKDDLLAAMKKALLKKKLTPSEAMLLALEGRPAENLTIAELLQYLT